ncbi:MAG TPA: hypothetical protein VHP83_23435, partial [Aggregatilineaceae bacterium]|nr:hypothetical protein [Aggregatilineaceae bacterium]
RQKIGFDLPITHWLQGVLRSSWQETLFAGSTLHLFDRASLSTLVARESQIHRIWPVFLLARWAALMGITV